jgi:hypothetical protein
VLRDLLDLRDLNTRITQVGAIADAQNRAVMGEVADVMQAVRGGQSWAVTEKVAVQQISDELHERANERLGASFATYCRLKIEAAARRLADEIATTLVYPPDSGRTSFVRAAIGAWARGTEVWQVRETEMQRVAAWLRPVDLPYRERRLHFLLAGVNALYPTPDTRGSRPPREELNALKAQAWDLLDELRTVPARVVRGLAPADVAFLNRSDLDGHLLDDPVQFAEAHEEEFTRLFTAYSAAIEAALGDGSAPLWEAFSADTATWEEEHQRALLARYFGFPLWDGLIFPTIALAELPQFTPIGVAQFSPLAAKALKPLGKDKLEGIPLHHFAGFTSAESRGNDYLWGRLDGVELILRTLYGAASPTPAAAATAPPADARAAVATAGGKVLQDGLRAVLDSEAGLDAITGLRKRLRPQVDALPVGVAPVLPDQRATAASNRSSSTEAIR